MINPKRKNGFVNNLRGVKKLNSSTKEEVMKEIAAEAKELNTEDLQKVKGVIAGIKLVRDTEKAAG